MKAADLLRFTCVSLAGHRLRSALIATAMAIGVAGVIVLTWLGDAARQYVVGEFRALGSNLVIVLPGRAETQGGAPPGLGETPRDLTLDDALALGRSPAVRHIAPVILGSAFVARGRLDREATVIGSTPDLFAIRKIGLARGRMWPAGDPRRATPACVIGATLETALFGATPALGQWLRIGDRRFRVLGTIRPRGRSLGLDLDQIVVIPVASARMLFDSPGLFRVLVEADGRDALPRARADIRRILRQRHEGEEDVTVITQEAVLATFDRILRALTLAVAAIAAISLLVAGILVMNVMLVAVAQRRQEIGVLGALGAPRRRIRALFLTEAVLLSLAGAALGAGLGEATTWLGARLYPVLAGGAPTWAVVAAVAVALVSGLLFGVSPANRAARLDPVEALSRR